jgi:hypothetical protein
MSICISNGERLNLNEDLWVLIENKNKKKEFEAEYLKEGDALKLGK